MAIDVKLLAESNLAVQLILALILLFSFRWLEPETSTSIAP
jgi:hypothetical protein